MNSLKSIMGSCLPAALLLLAAAVPASAETFACVRADAGGASAVPALTMEADGSYVAGEATGTFVREGTEVRLIGGALDKAQAKIETGEAGRMVLVFSGIDAGATRCVLNGD